MEYKSPFDSEDLEMSHEKKIDSKVAEKLMKRDYLIHKTFYQTDSGKELLDMWIKNGIIMKPVFSVGEQSSDFDKGIAQGTQQFIRNILITCEKVQNNER